MLSGGFSRHRLAQRFAGALAIGVFGPRTALGRPTAPPPSGSITDVGGIRVGHFTDKRRPTGCTVILFDSAVAAGADYDGSAPGESLA